MTATFGMDETIWRTSDGSSHFIIADSIPHRPGPLLLHSFAGEEIAVDPAWVARFEVTQAEAQAWAQEEFGFVLDHLRQRIDAKLAKARAALDAAKAAPVSPASPISPDAVPATWELILKLPRAIVDALSGDPSRVAQANDALGASQQRLVEAGVDVAPKFGQFAERLARLRQDFPASRGKRSD